MQTCPTQFAYCWSTSRSRFGVCLWLQRETAEAFRIDAKAEGEKILIGGWETGAEADMAQARWFSVTLDRRSAP